MANEDKKASGVAVVLRERFIIFPGSPLPELALPSAQAFHAEERRDGGKGLFALIVRPGFPARTNVLRALKGVDSPGLMGLVEWGVVDWPPASRKVMALIYARPTGGRVAGSMTDIKRIEEADVMRKIITPVAAALKSLKTAGVTHRAIRPTNMFWATPERDRLVLGDCASVPPAYEQPSVVEPVESAMAMPAARGNGASPDDYYAFGASLAILLQGRNPGGALPDEAVIRQKTAQGSYGMLAGEARLPLPMVEILRGTLCDDESQRWDAEAMELWISGRRLTPLVAKIEKRAARAFVFSNREYFTARELAIAMAQSWDAVLQQIGDGKLELWLRRALENKEKADAVALALGSAGGAVDRRQAGEVTVARICMILDAGAPIRYKGISSMADGLGTLLAVTMVEGGDVKTIAEALMRDVPKAWFETRDSYNPDNSILDGMYRTQKGYLERATIGNGIERVVYEINESMPCISPFTVEDYVVELRDLLPALNAFAKKADGKGSPIDRHVAAFIAARASFEIERQMLDIALPDPTRATLAMLNLLALIQWRLGQGGLYGLSTWVTGLLGPAIASYHNRERRKELEREIPRIAKEGSLVDLSRLLDSPEERAADMRGFEAARMEWHQAYQQLQDIESGRVDVEAPIRTAQQVAALISLTLCFITVALLVISKIF
jgi:hypothetical protein